jgi:hypothetical protein
MMMSDTDERDPKRQRQTANGRGGEVHESRDDEDAVSIDGIDLWNDDAASVGLGEARGDSNRVDAPSGLDANDNGDTDLMSVTSFEDGAEVVEEVEDAGLNAEAEGTNAEAEEVEEDPNDQDFLLGQDEDEADIEMEGAEDERRNRHWRNMVWDKTKRKFVFEMDGFDPVVDDAIPKVGDWKKLHPRDMTEARVTFNQGRETLLLHWIDEYNAFVRRLDHLNISKSREGLFDYLYGERSRLAIALTKALDIEYKELCHFLGTMYFAARFGYSLKRLKEDDDVNTEGLMESKRYNAIWRKIGLAGRNGEQEKAWMAIETAINEDVKDFFLIPGFRSSVSRIVLDDDKLRFHFPTSAVRRDANYLCGMKPCQHTKANTRGFTIDTAVLAATGFLVHFRVLRQGSSNEDSYESMVKFMFGHSFTSVGAAKHLALFDIMFCSDRGYWTPKLILLLLGYGAIVCGTLKRAWYLPYTYDQKPPLYGREQIEGKFGRSCFLAFCRWKSIMMKVSAWRGSTGNVSLAMNSDNGGEKEPICYDFCFMREGDAKWYKSDTPQLQRDLKAIEYGSVLTKKLPEELIDWITDHIEFLTTGKVTMLTVTDHDFTWFAQRMFSFTSSQSDAILKFTAALIEPTDNVYPSFKAILEYSGQANRLRSATDIEDDSNDDTTIDPMSGPFVKALVKLLRAKELDNDTITKCRKDASLIESKLKNNRLDPSKLIPVLVALGVSHENAGKIDDITRKKKLRSFIKSVKDLKPGIEYYFPYDKVLMANEIETELRNRVGVEAVNAGHVPSADGIFKPSNKTDRIKALHYLDKNPELVREHRDTPSDLRNAIISGTVSKSFLKPLEGGGKSAAQLGHQNERPYLRQFFEDCKDGIVPGMKLCDIRDCGLAMQKTRPYVRDSADGIAFEETEHDLSYDGDDYFSGIKSHPVELKCRSGEGSDNTLAEALRIQKRIGELRGHANATRANLQKSVYIQVKASEFDLLVELIPKSSELIQAIHHAFTWGTNRTSFLVGGPDGKILYGVIITFEPQLLAHYGKVIDYLYENGMKVFYENEIKDLPLKYIESVLLADETLKKKYELNDFVTSLLYGVRFLVPVQIVSSQNFPYLLAIY